MKSRYSIVMVAVLAFLFSGCRVAAAADTYQILTPCAGGKCTPVAKQSKPVQQTKTYRTPFGRLIKWR
jgi:hypothetical protein